MAARQQSSQSGRSIFPTFSFEEFRCLDLSKQDLLYTPCYCEENIYMLCREIQRRDYKLFKGCSVIFVSNEFKTVALWQQLAGHGEEHVVIWDYHVFLYYCNEDKSFVYDFDTTLPFPCPAEVYISKTFQPNAAVDKRYRPKFRLLSAEVYLEHFESDRSHMLNEDGMFVKPPPAYPPITKGLHNLNKYITMNPEMNNADESKYGKVVSFEEFYTTVCT
ncbi:N-terminal glutamine amidase-domain-containing protein [Mycotypha africana]|uniref:N-terminal glutamine amidase-domain-containing protein n=1 Tax=Mycotypha africana TaxID=64632 RepID=UPI0023010E08|nr:N-terminal glutamine amidase-domain-containing protein [Mycotypha africana]KAI8984791.1 N-terminal glutamine amidase-domain-containing protein [Mycotypha africana]